MSSRRAPVRPVPWRERSRLVRWWRLWQTRRPLTFNEKVRYKMLRDHRELMVTFADKAAARDHVASVVGAHVLPRLLHLFDDPRRLADAPLPSAYVVKPTHGSGVAIVVSPAAAAGARLPDRQHSWGYRQVRPEFAPAEHLVALGESWVAQLYGQGPNREWAYGHVPRRIMVEELLVGADGAVPDDYKFFVFHGTCRYVQVDRGRFETRTQDFFTREWSHLPLNGGHPWATPRLPRPARLEEMIRLAQRLGQGTDFVRVDLYDLPERIVFGELSSFPAGGDSPFDPESYNVQFGSHWTPPRRYR
ncbi:MAG: ATP-grasp fold amidoligase family protein [Nocardioidaceae bacterium]